MTPTSATNYSRQPLFSHLLVRGSALLALALTCSTLTGCLVGGYSSRGGAFFWPGGLGGILLLVLLFLFLRGRR